MVKKTLFCSVMLTATAFCAAGPTALNFIPTADILGHREIFASYYVAGVEGKKRYSSWNAIQVGLGDRLEFGTDNDFLGNTYSNIKVKLFDSEDGKFALSGGYMNIIEDYSESYLAGRMSCGTMNFHLGWYENGDSRLIAGVDFPVMNDWTIMADYVSGRDGSWWLGLSGPVKWVNGLSITASYGKSHLKGEPAALIFTLGYGVRF